MKTKKILFAVLTAGVLFASCSTNSTAEEDQLYHDGVDRTKITTSNKKSVDRTKITTSNRQSVDRTKITTSNKK